MTERPILFSGPMVRALLAGTKTQTRRLLKLPHGYWETTPGGLLVPIPANSPYGQPGDRLWVRETWCQFPENAPDGNGEQVYYAASQPDGDSEVRKIMERNGVRWKPSIHMPRWASRILLEVTEVRVQRLHDISEADALAEGIETMGEHDRCARPTGRILGLGHPRGEPPYWMRPVQAYALLWESINGPGSWDPNPWVWAVTFSRSPLAPGVKGD